MLEQIINQEVSNTFTGTLLALIFAGIVWMLKTAYDKHTIKIISLAKLERIFVIDIELVNDNFEQVAKWIKATDGDRPYSFYIEKYFTSDDEALHLDSELVSKVLTVNYKLRRTEADLLKLYDLYWEGMKDTDTLTDQSIKSKQFRIIQNNFKQHLTSFQTNHIPIEKDLIETVGHIRAAHNVRRHSLFGYLSLIFFSDIFPRVTPSSIKKESAEVRKNAERNKSQPNNS